MKPIEQTQRGIALSKYFFIPQRTIVAIMGFFAIVTGYTQRQCLSMAITQMVVHRNKSINGDSIVCPEEDSDKIQQGGGTYEWTEEEQGRALSFFYFGYIITHIPGGLMGDRFGFKWVLNGGLIWSVIATLLIPVTVYHTEHIGLTVMRIAQGLGQGVIFPTLSVMVSHWVPKNERGRLGAVIMGGGQIGNVLLFAFAGLLLDSFEWPWVFYIFGIIGAVWCLTFTFLCYSDPVTHPFIKPAEREYLVERIGGNIERTDLPPVPWAAIFTSSKIYALLSAQIGHDWGFYIMSTYLPKYYNDVMNLNIKSNGFYATFPFIAMWISSVSHGFVADILIKKNYMSITNVRKMMTTLAAIFPAVFLILASYAGCHRPMVVMFFTLTLFAMGGYYAGMKLTPVDLSPNYAGTIMAISNGSGAIIGWLSPYLVGVLTPGATLEEWRFVFWVAFIVLTLTALPYCLWESGEVQEWNDPDFYNQNKRARDEAKRQAKEAKKEAKRQQKEAKMEAERLKKEAKRLKVQG
uniref:Major facilitator superfamily (MFS) profile domain-containing protein n=1 Tax=Glossina morsitans morsitans TaxID=37546 RepID=A0A1B0FK41_GLOMM